MDLKEHNRKTEGTHKKKLIQHKYSKSLLAVLLSSLKFRKLQGKHVLQLEVSIAGGIYIRNNAKTQERFSGPVTFHVEQLAKVLCSSEQ